MTARSDSAKAIFLDCLEKHAPEAWPAFLDDACAGDAELRATVEKLLRARRELGTFNEQSPPTLDPPETERPGAFIGPYKLLQAIGEGGMGTVWMAQQTEPVKRLVAVKLIRAGMDSKQVIARFEAERQALALMDHPNIAKVLDAGVSPPVATGGLGRPYFVMDLVRGLPITQYCDEHHLTPRQRLELFVPVCQAVQHAHQKGVIHRDLKPSNVLVALYDGKPVPKVIDFGVAKAAGQSLTDKTLVTGFGAIVGTLEYMSPEQAEINQLDIDTRSDIYSLGVLLYELLTGSTPFSKKDLEKAGMLEMLRVIREDEPSKPSTKLSSSDALPTLSANRGTEPAKLTRMVRGELDWIVMKALEKNRNRRYETANGFAMDVQRYLSDEQVMACPPSPAYRLRKFARRNKTALAVAALVVSFLVVLGGGIGWVVGDRAARQVAIDAEVNLALTEVLQLKEQRRYSEAASAARRVEGRSADGASGTIQSRAREIREDMEMAHRLEEIRLIEGTQAERDNFTFADVDRAYTVAFHEYGIDVDRLEAGVAAERIRARGIRVELAATLDDWAKACWVSRSKDDAGWRSRISIARLADPDPWHNKLRDAYEQWYSRRPVTKAFEELAASATVEQLPPSTLALIGLGLYDVGLTEPAIKFLLRAQRLHPSDFWINTHLAMCYQWRQPYRPDEAIRFFSAALAVRPRSSATHNNLGSAFSRKKQWDDAIAARREAIRLKPDHWIPRANLGITLATTGRADEAIAEYREAVRLKPDVPSVHYNLSTALVHQGRLDEAIAEYREAIRLKPDVLDYHYGLSAALAQQGHLDEAFAASQAAYRLKSGGPRDPSKLVDLAEALYQQGKKTQARQLQEQQIAYLRGVLQANPQTPGHQQWLYDNYLVLSNNANLKHDELAKVAEEFPRIFPERQDEYVRAAMCLCGSARDVHKDDTLAEDQRRQLAQRYAERAVAMLRQSIAKGNKDANRLKTDEAFELLRSREDFQKLVQDLERKTP